MRGEVRAEIRTDEPERFRWLTEVLVGDLEEPVPFSIEGVRFHQHVVILKLGRVDDRIQAEALRNQWLQVPLAEAIPLAEDEMFLYQLLGLQVFTLEGERLGEVVEVLETGANDVFVVRSGKDETKDLLLPDLPDVVLKIDLQAGRVLVNLIPGLR